MARRKTPILLRRAPLSGRVMALTNYRFVDDGKTLSVVGDGKHDVTNDFEELVLQLLMDECEDLVPILEVAAGLNEGCSYEKLTDDERAQIGRLWERVKALVDRHNERADASA